MSVGGITRSNVFFGFLSAAFFFFARLCFDEFEHIVSSRGWCRMCRGVESMTKVPQKCNEGVG
jgi:hypothetical protein